MGYLAAFVLSVLVAFLVGGPLLVKKVLRGFFVGNDLYVFLTIDGQLVCYKNPNRQYVHEDKPLLIVPYEILESGEYDATYFSSHARECRVLQEKQYRGPASSERCSNNGKCETLLP